MIVLNKPRRPSRAVGAPTRKIKMKYIFQPHLRNLSYPFGRDVSKVRPLHVLFDSYHFLFPLDQLARSLDKEHQIEVGMNDLLHLGEIVDHIVEDTVCLVDLIVRKRYVNF